MQRSFVAELDVICSCSSPKSVDPFKIYYIQHGCIMMTNYICHTNSKKIWETDSNVRQRIKENNQAYAYYWDRRYDMIV